jgi:pimeloyl-ACP methyl ester carboxylesterase
MSLIIEGTNIYLTECGSGSPILFLHGAPDSAEMWSGVTLPSFLGCLNWR